MKHILPLLALWLLPLATMAQTTPAWSWATALSTPVDLAVIPSLAADAAGNTYVAGGFMQTITLAPGTTLTSQGGYDGYLAKYSPTGALLWYRQLAGPDAEYFQALVADANGNVSLLGVASNGAQLGSASFTLASYSYGIVLARLDAQGQGATLQGIAYGGLTISSLARDPAGDFYFSGSTSSSAIIGGTTISVPAGSFATDQYVAKISAAGVPQWVRQGGRVVLLNGVPTPSFNSHLAAGSDGVYFNWTCNGTTGGFGSLTLPTSLGDYDGLAVKFDPQGNPLWAKRLGGSGTDVSNYGQLDATGRFVVPGFSTVAGFFSAPTSTIFSNGYVTVLEPTAGNQVWTSQLTATTAGAFRDAASDAAGNLYVLGSFAGQGGISGTSLSSAGGADVVVASYSPNGSLRWIQQSSGTGSEVPYVIALGGSNQLTVAGSFLGSSQFGSTILSTGAAAGVRVPFVAHLGGVLDSRPGTAAAPLACYPNPAASSGTLALPALPAGTELALLDATGRAVRRQPAAPTLPLAGLAPGLYQVQATAPDGAQWHSRLVVE